MAGTGIGTFSDRLRDAVRGGGPVRRGPAASRASAPGWSPTPTARRPTARRPSSGAGSCCYQDLIKVGLAGNLAGYRSSTARAPRSRARTSTTTASRPGTPPTRRDHHLRRRPRQRDALRRAAVQAAAEHADGRPGADEHRRPGDDGARRRARRSGTPAPTCCARSRSTATPTTPATGSTGSTGLPRRQRCGSGLPPARRQRGEVAVHAAAARRPGARRRPPTTSPPRSAAAADLLRIRFSSPLFRLGSADRIQERVEFPIAGTEQVPGVITMTLDDRAGTDLDRRWEGIVVVFNATPQAQTQVVAGLAGTTYRLHPVQAGWRRHRRQGVDVRRRRGLVHRPGADGRGLRCGSVTDVTVGTPRFRSELNAR